MADREERQLLRQRGAGARDIDEFSLSLGGLSSSRATSPDDRSSTNAPVLVPLASGNEDRQQRFLMRQRGAGARDVDFSMNLGIPPASSPTGRISIAGSTTSSNTTKLQASQNATPLVAGSRSQAAQGTTLAPVLTVRTIDTPRSAISVEDNQLENQEAIFLDDDGVDNQPEIDIADENGSVSANTSVNGSASSTTSARKRRKKKSVLIKSKRRKTTSTGSNGRVSIVGENDEDDAESATGPDASRTHVQGSNKSATSRKSVSIAEDPSAKDDSVMNISLASADNENPTPRAGPSGVYSMFNKATRPGVPAIPRIQREHGIRNTDNQSLNVSKRPQIGPRSGESSTKARRKSAGRPKGSRKTKEKQATVEIRIHRLAHTSRLEFLTEEDDELAIGQVSAFPKRKTPNSIEILAQNCLEIVGRRLTALNEQTTTDSERSNPNRKVRIEAVRAFGEELDSRLMMMTTALEHNLSLTRNLKAAQQAKTAHSSTLLDLRRQREAIELQQDSVRAANEDASKASNERFELNSLLADIQLAVQRGKEGESRDGDEDLDDEDERLGLAMRLRSVAEVASSAQGRFGLLQRVKALNGLLEGFVDDAGL